MKAARKHSFVARQAPISCCAFAASGQVTTVATSSVIKSRRCMRASNPEHHSGCLERDDLSSNRHPDLHYWWSMIPACAGTSLFRKPESTLAFARACFSGSCSSLSNRCRSVRGYEGQSASRDDGGAAPASAVRRSGRSWSSILLEGGPVQQRPVHPGSAFIPAFAALDQTPRPRAGAGRPACLTGEGFRGGHDRLALWQHIGRLRAECLLMMRLLGESGIR